MRPTAEMAERKVKLSIMISILFDTVCIRIGRSDDWKGPKARYF